MSTPHETISAAYAETEGTDTRRDERLASTFQPSPDYERHARLADEDPEAFARLPRQTRLATGYFIEQRDAARRLGRTV